LWSPSSIICYCEAAEEDGNPGTPGKGIWSRKYGRWVPGTAGERGRWQHNTELDVDKRSSGNDKA